MLAYRLCNSITSGVKIVKYILLSGHFLKFIKLERYPEERTQQYCNISLTAKVLKYVLNI